MLGSDPFYFHFIFFIFYFKRGSSPLILFRYPRRGSYSSFFHFNSCWLKNLLSSHEQFKQPKAEIDLFKCGAYPTYWRTLVNPSTLRELRLEAYFNFTFRFQPFTLKKKVVVITSFWQRYSMCELSPTWCWFCIFAQSLKWFQHPTALSFISMPADSKFVFF